MKHPTSLLLRPNFAKATTGTARLRTDTVKLRGTRKIASLLIVISLLFSQASFVIAQTLDPVTTDTTTTTEPVSEPVPEPEPVVEETVTPPADTTGPAFISVATASSEETEVNIVWTTDEPAYGYIEYGETAGYGLATPKSASAALDHTVAVTNLTPGTTYHYRIVAEDESGNVSYSKDRTFETAFEVVAIDNVPPEITQVSATNITTSEATISWVTNELAQGRVEYGTTAVYGVSSPLATDYATEHSASLSNLEPGTEYHYRVVVQDESGNEAVSPDEIFTTDTPPEPPPQEEPATEEEASTTPETTEPQVQFAISEVETESVGTSTATIVWTTNEAATSQVFYGTGETYASSSALAAANVTSHAVRIAGLKPGTNYFYKVVSRNAAGAVIEKAGFEFNTLYEQKIAIPPPKISQMAVQSVGTSTAVIVFITSVPATGKIRYGTTTAYEQSDGGHTVLLTQHSHPLSGLSPNTEYNFIAIVRDVKGNETVYENQTFRTSEDSARLSSQVSAAPENAEESEEPVTDWTTIAPARSTGGSAGRYSYTPTRTIKEPKLVKVEGLDGQVMFRWNPLKAPKATPRSTQIQTNIIIVRNLVRYPESPTFGKIVYKGNSGLFTDTKLKNGTTYYYSVFALNQFNSYSQPTRLKVTPTAVNEEMELEVVPPVVQKNPIYTFSKKLSHGDESKHVEHLQVLLASEPSLYPRGLITGYFGSLTEKAVRAFQKRYELPVTGVADLATLKKFEKLSSIETVKDKASVYDAALPRDLKLGSSGGDVVVLQQFLINAGVYPEALVTGYFGPLTESALKKFQQVQNISPAVGYFGSVTKKRVLNLIRLRGVSF